MKDNIVLWSPLGATYIHGYAFEIEYYLYVRSTNIFTHSTNSKFYLFYAIYTSSILHMREMGKQGYYYFVSDIVILI